MRVLMPLPAADFDPTEAGVSWQVLARAGHDVVFATPAGVAARADALMLDGRGLDPWAGIPALRNLTLFGRMLAADARGRGAYASMSRDAAFRAPLTYDATRCDDFDALLLPGGHRAAGMRAYLEDHRLHALVADFFDAAKPVGAICHGVVLAARSTSQRTGRSVLHGRRTTALTWQLERAAWNVGRFARFWDPNYYRTYLEAPGDPPGFASVQSEVTRALASPGDFLDVPRDAPDYRRKTSGTNRDTPDDARPAWVVRDGTYVSARWPGDVHTFAAAFVATLSEASA